jgi:hypothetical protein
MIRLLLAAAAAGVGAAIAVASSVTGMSDDTSTAQVHCAYCGAIDDGRSALRFWFIDGDLFCETCAAGTGACMGG